VQAELPIRYLQEHVPAVVCGCIDGGAGTVMADSGSVNGIPATASHFCSPPNCATGSASRAW